MNHLPKVKNRSLENRGLPRVDGPRAYALFLLFLCSLVVFCGCATAKAPAKSLLQPQAPAVITGIDVQDNSVTITASKPFIYTIYRPGDPYKIVIDPPDLTVGAFNEANSRLIRLDDGTIVRGAGST